MRLKRLYTELPEGLAPLAIHKETGVGLRVAGVKVERAKRVQKVTQNVIDGGLAEGWLSMGGGRLTIHGVDGDVVYQIVRAPGGYCCHCDAPVELTATAGGGPTPGQKHVAEMHAGVASPDPQHPAGYRGENHYTLVLVGDEVDAPQTREEAAAYERDIRVALADKLRAKYNARRMPPPIAGAADFVFNIAKGSVAGYYRRVDGNDPTNSAIIILIIDANGDSDATMRDRDTISALLGGLANEVTNTNYARKTLTDADLTAFSPDDANDRVDLDIPDQTWTAIAAGTAWTDFVTAYDNDTTGGDDTNLEPMTLHDFAVTPDGSDITAQIAAAGFYRAS